MSNVVQPTKDNYKQPVFAWAFAAIIVIAVWYIYQSAQPERVYTATIADAETPSDITSVQDKAAIINYFNSNNEPTIKDAIWSSDSALLLGVIDDQTNRDGLARYACQVLLDDFNTPSVSVYIVDIVKIANGEKWQQLGSAHC